MDRAGAQLLEPLGQEGPGRQTGCGPPRDRRSEQQQGGDGEEVNAGLCGGGAGAAERAARGPAPGSLEGLREGVTRLDLHSGSLLGGEGGHGGPALVPLQTGRRCQGSGAEIRVGVSTLGARPLLSLSLQTLALSPAIGPSFLFH